MAAAPRNYTEGINQARQLIAQARLADPDEHFPYKHRDVLTLLDKNPPAGPQGPKDASRRAADFITREIADASRDYIDAQAHYLNNIEDRFARLQFRAAADWLEATRSRHRATRVDDQGNPRMTVTASDPQFGVRGQRAGTRTITASGFFVQNYVDELDPTNTGLDLTLTTHKWALVSDTYAPNFDTHVSFANLTNEVFGTGWATGGVLFSAAAAGATSLAPTVTISPTGTLKWGMNDVSVAGTSLTAAMAAVAYADALTTPTADALLLLVDFVTAATTNNGTFGIQWAAPGVATIDMTP
jgi:hypothetical protein